MRVIRAFQSNTSAAHLNSLTLSSADRLRASQRKLQLARQREGQKSSLKRTLNKTMS